MWRGCFAVGNGVAGIKSFFLFFFKDYQSILVSDFSNVAFRSAPISSVDKHQHFSLDSIRLRLEWNRKQLDIPMKGVAFPTGRFGIPYGAIHPRAARHRICENVGGFNVWN